MALNKQEVSCLQQRDQHALGMAENHCWGDVYVMEFVPGFGLTGSLGEWAGLGIALDRLVLEGSFQIL